MTGNDVTYTYSTSGRTEDGAAQSERRANLFVFPSQSNVGVANPMHAAVDDRYYSYYAYDYGGERGLKLTGTNNVVDVNADHMSTHSVLDSPTLYPSAYMVVTSKGYTKHYYAGAERVAARIGGGWSDGPVPLAGKDDSLSARADLLYTQSLGQTNGRVLEENEPGCFYGPLVESEGLNATIDEIPNHLQAVAEADCGTFLEAMHQLVEGGPGGPENDVYFYHSDHLGSASWITDSAGQAIQHLQYLPFGEPYVNQRTSNYSERFTFTGKEKDAETGYGYFGARYMDHELMTMWLSVDPLADKYPSLTPFHYCRWNPLSRIDSDGKMDSLYLCGSDKMKKDALIFMQNQCGNLKLSEKDGFVSYTGEPKTEKEKYIANLLSDKTIYVELRLKEDNNLPNKKQINEGGGAYGGNYFIYDNKDSKEIEYVWATQYINVKQAKKVNQNGLVFWHEAAEAYESALLSREKKVESPTNTDSPDCNYREAHKNASKLFPGDVIIENGQYHIYSL